MDQFDPNLPLIPGKIPGNESSVYEIPHYPDQLVEKYGPDTPDRLLSYIKIEPNEVEPAFEYNIKPKPERNLRSISISDYTVAVARPYEDLLLPGTPEDVADHTAAAASEVVAAAGIVVELLPATEEGDAKAVALYAQRIKAARREYDGAQIGMDDDYRRIAEARIGLMRSTGRQILRIFARDGDTSVFYRELEKLQAARKNEQTEQ